ncbi:MAG: efflux RND transporter periplasmic adaptor subunit [Planctomycetota bacterium]
MRIALKFLGTLLLAAVLAAAGLHFAFEGGLAEWSDRTLRQTKVVESPAGEETSGHANGHQGHGGRESGETPTVYYCPMHPTYRSDRPGDCPICNMSLVPLEKDQGGDGSPVEGHATVTLSPQRQQLIGVKTGKVERRPARKTVRAFARVDYDERKLASINLKFGGWVEELKVKSTGEKVEVGTPLLVIYSPELLEAQRNYLLALENASLESASELATSLAQQGLQSARDRLRLWDITAEQISKLEETREPQRVLTIYSQVKGVVIERQVVQGTYVQPGTDLYRIADLDTVWALAEVYEQELPQVQVGMEAEIELATAPGDSFAGKVSFIYPYLDEPTRTVRVRIEVDNPAGKLSPGMYAQASLVVDLGDQLMVPDTAILPTGERDLAFVDLGEGKFEPREVTVSTRAGGYAVVAKGLEEGETVVISSNFLIDSESRIKEALLQGATSGAHQH